MAACSRSSWGSSPGSSGLSFPMLVIAVLRAMLSWLFVVAHGAFQRMGHSRISVRADVLAWKAGAANPNRTLAQIFRLLASNLTDNIIVLGFLSQVRM